MGRREDERIRYADWAAEQAASAMLDSAWDYAIIWSDRAVDGTAGSTERNGPTSGWSTSSPLGSGTAH
jgi:hypothetical protein